MRTIVLLCALVAARSAAGAETEVVHERYPNRKVKIERHMTLDDEGNYINHGAWKWWDQVGQLRAAGEYNQGRRQGTWTQWLGREDAPLLSEAPFNNFQAPFTSHAEFKQGQLHGTWMIFDAAQRQCAEIQLQDGTRHGQATLWQRTGKIYYQAEFDHGAVVGELHQTDTTGKLQLVGDFLDGCRVFTRVSKDSAERKLAEASFLGPRTEVIRQDDFWHMKLAEVSPRGEERQHGPHCTWYPSGQQRHIAQFEENQLSGPARWWHANGQPATTGHYLAGQAAGRWTWWHENGLKAAHVTFSAGAPAGEVLAWDSNGRRLPASKLALRERPAEPAKTAPK